MKMMNKKKKKNPRREKSQNPRRPKSPNPRRPKSPNQKSLNPRREDELIAIIPLLNIFSFLIIRLFFKLFLFILIKKYKR